MDILQTDEEIYELFGIKKSVVDELYKNADEQYDAFISTFKREIVVSDRVKEIGIGLRLYDALSPRKSSDGINVNSILKTDKETRDILVDEDALMDLIRAINPNQKRRRLRFAKRDDSWWK